MNRDLLAALWKQIRGQVRQAWGELTEEDLDEIAGRREILAGKLQQKYGYSKMEAESEIESLLCEVEVELQD